MTNAEDPIIGNEARNGLTKREHFAAMAMQGFLASYSGAMQDPSPENVAAKSLDYADALIEQLNKQP